MKKPLNTVLMVIQGILLVYCILGSIYTIAMGGGHGLRGPAIVCLAALAATAYYVFSGYKKSSANVYKLMLTLCAAASLMYIVPTVYDVQSITAQPFMPALAATAYGLCFGLYLLLAYVPDLGKTRSNTLIVIIFVIFFALYLYNQICFPGPFVSDGTRYDYMRNLGILSMAALAVNAGICNHFKYEDKAKRGRK